MSPESPVEDVLDELAVRLTRARRNLESLIVDRGDDPRLQGKVEGVSLALSYVEEERRLLRAR